MENSVGGDVPNRPEVLHVDADEQVNNIEEALQKVLRSAQAEGGVKVGVNQVMKAIESKSAYVVLLADNVEEQAIKKAVTVLAKDRKVPVISVPESKDLGCWAGLCKVDREGQARNIVAASCVAITKYGSTGHAYEYLQNHIKSMAK